MDRFQKRKLDRDTAGIIKKAKKDLGDYMSSLTELPSEGEIKAWQAGYIAGLNRGANNAE